MTDERVLIHRTALAATKTAGFRMKMRDSRRTPLRKSVVLLGLCERVPVSPLLSAKAIILCYGTSTVRTAIVTDESKA
jgi:hypothetical protein